MVQLKDNPILFKHILFCVNIWFWIFEYLFTFEDIRIAEQLLIIFARRGTFSATENNCPFWKKGAFLKSASIVSALTNSQNTQQEPCTTICWPTLGKSETECNISEENKWGETFSLRKKTKPFPDPYPQYPKWQQEFVTLLPRGIHSWWAVAIFGWCPLYTPAS